MALVYLDTSALGRILLGEPDAPAVLAALGEYELAAGAARHGLRILAPA